MSLNQRKILNRKKEFSPKSLKIAKKLFWAIFKRSSATWWPVALTPSVEWPLENHFRPALLIHLSKKRKTNSIFVCAAHTQPSRVTLSVDYWAHTDTIAGQNVLICCCCHIAFLVFISLCHWIAGFASFREIVSLGTKWELSDCRVHSEIDSVRERNGIAKVSGQLCDLVQGEVSSVCGLDWHGADGLWR